MLEDEGWTNTLSNRWSLHHKPKCEQFSLLARRDLQPALVISLAIDSLYPQRLMCNNLYY